MNTTLAVGVITAAFSTYPSLGDKGLIEPKAATNAVRVEHAIDKGPIVEMIVRCPRGVAIISYSKVERLYCTPKHKCLSSINAAVAKSCG